VPSYVNMQCVVVEFPNHSFYGTTKSHVTVNPRSTCRSDLFHTHPAEPASLIEILISIIYKFKIKDKNRKFGRDLVGFLNRWGDQGAA
jgi:hypothetical protein